MRMREGWVMKTEEGGMIVIESEGLSLGLVQLHSREHWRVADRKEQMHSAVCS